MSGDVGVLKGIVTLDVAAVTKGMSDGADSVEHFARKAKKMANDFAMVGGAVTASVIAMVDKVKDVSPLAHASIENLTLATQTLGVQVAQVAAPALAAMAKSLRDVANWFAGLSPATKQHIADLIVIAAKVAVAALAFGRLMEIVKGLTVLFEGISVAMAAIFSPVGAIIVAIIAALLVLRSAWNNNWGGIRDVMRSVISDISGYWTKFTDFLGDIWKTQVDEAADGLKAIVRLYFAAMKVMSDAGIIKANPLAGLEESGIDKGIDAAAGTLKSPKAMKQLALEGSSAFGVFMSNLTEDLKEKFKELMKAMGFDFTSKPGAVAPGVASPEAKAMEELVNSLRRSSGLAENQRGIDVSRQQRDFNNIGAPQAVIWGQMTKGFADFNDALSKGSQALAARTALEGQAKVFELQAQQLNSEGATELAAQALDAANQMRMLAQGAGDMATKAEEAAKAFSEMKDATQKELLGALKVAGDAFTSNMGKFGATISAGIQGFQSGGVWGAVIAVVMQFITQFKGWTQILNIGNGLFQEALRDMSRGLGNLLSGLQPLLGAISFITHALHGGLDQTLSVIGVVLRAIAPILTVIGVAMGLLSSAIQPLTQIIGALFDVIGKLISFGLGPVVILFMYLKVAADGLALGFNTAINELEKWIHDTLHIDVGNNQGATDAAQAQFNADKAQADAFGNAWLKNPFDALQTLDQNAANAAGALGAAADAAQQVTEQFLNVPEGIKVAMYAFNATAASGGGSTSSTNGGLAGQAARARYQLLGTTIDPNRYPKKKP